MSDLATPAADSTEQAAASQEGQFIWYELVTTDPDAAIDFYTHVVGWTAADFPHPDVGFRYTILSAGGRGVAGVMELPEQAKAAGSQPGWLGVIRVADVDAATRAVAETGGSVHKQPDNIPTVGRFSVVVEPGGAVYELLAPTPMEEEPAPLARDAVGNVGWHELYTAGGEKKAFDFFSKLYGWKTETEMDMGARGTYRIVGKDGVSIGGMMDKPANMPVSAWTFYFNVDGLDAAVERIRAKGGEVLMGPMEVPGGSWIIQGRDPQGAHFALVSPAR